MLEPITEPITEPRVAINTIKYGVAFNLHLRKGKYYISVNAPVEIAHLYADKRKRVSSGTSDKRLANEVAVKILAKIHDDFDLKIASLDSFVESLRPYLDIHGINVGDWYTKGFISHEFYGVDTWLWQTTGGKYKFSKRKDFGYHKLPEPPEGWKPKPPKDWKPKVKKNATDKDLPPLDSGWSFYCEKFEASNYQDLAQLVTKLGYAVPTGALEYLDEAERASMVELQQPLKPDLAKLMQMMRDPNFATSPMGIAISDNINDLPREPLVNVADIVLKEVKFSDLVEPYLKSKAEAKKEQSQRKKACDRIIQSCGDLPLQNYTALHAYDLAKIMHEEGYSNSQIKKMITYGRGLFRYASKNRDTNGQQYLKYQPWIDLELAEFGTSSRPYIPLSDEELVAVFDQDIADQERLLLTILITTGMRLDEAALMTWERVIDYNGVRCFSLVNDKEDVKVKNRGSMRYIPVPEILKPLLGKGGKGRLFNYRIDQDGKAQAKASDAVMPYIRNVTTNDRKVAHSLRGNFKDLIREADVSKEINDFITGHAQGDVGGKYGAGPSLSKRFEVLNLLPQLARFPYNIIST